MTLPRWAKMGRDGWKWVGQERPSFAIAPGDGQESVWDYPRPPRLEADPRLVEVRLGRDTIARSTESMRVLETASPPTFYIPPEHVRQEFLEPAAGSSRCEWKGEARYWTVAAGETRVERVGWSYDDPLPGFEPIKGYFSFYPARLECYVDSIRVAPQPGRFYGGWVTPELVGPFKGEAGSGGW